jgi:hypothetical protein
MKMKDLLPDLIAGTPIKRKPWRGFWKYDPRTKNIYIYTKEGEVIPFDQTQDVLFTLAGIVSEDWEIATNDNCDIPVKEV